jgi:hypothetical protein
MHLPFQKFRHIQCGCSSHHDRNKAVCGVLLTRDQNARPLTRPEPKFTRDAAEFLETLP